MNNHDFWCLDPDMEDDEDLAPLSAADVKDAWVLCWRLSLRWLALCWRR